ncbi:MAG: sialidase family protein, partial [bacterium]
QTFQVFAQRLDASGQLLGAAFDPSIEPTPTQFYPAVTTTPDGAIYLAYTRSETVGDEWVYHARFAPGASTPDASPMAVVIGRVGTGAAYATSLSTFTA